MLELILVLAVFASLTAIALLNIGRINTGRLLAEAGDELRRGLSQAQSLALAPPYDKQPDIDGYRIVFPQAGASGATRYQLWAVAGPNRRLLLFEDELASGVEIAPVEGSLLPEITYQIVDQGRLTSSIVPVDGQLRFRLQFVQNPSDYLSVTIWTVTGQVEVQKAGAA